MGGPDIHSTISGVCHRISETEEGALETLRKLLSYLPSNNLDDPPRSSEQSESADPYLLDQIIPESENEPYDMIEVINLIIDQDSFFEILAIL